MMNLPLINDDPLVGVLLSFIGELSLVVGLIESDCKPISKQYVLVAFRWGFRSRVPSSLSNRGATGNIS